MDNGCFKGISLGVIFRFKLQYFSLCLGLFLTENEFLGLFELFCVVSVGIYRVYYSMILNCYGEWNHNIVS